MLKEISTQDAPAALGPYSQAIEKGGMIFVSGQIPIDPVTGNIPDSIEEQTKQVLKNISSILNIAGLFLGNVVSTTVYLTDLSDFQPMNDVYAQAFTAPYPARACVEVSKLPKGVKVEISVVAIR